MKLITRLIREIHIQVPSKNRFLKAFYGPLEATTIANNESNIRDTSKEVL